MKHVYFIKPIGLDGPIKIGCSHSPDGRRDTLETWAPFALEVVAEIEGHFDLEQRFHAMFWDSHERREWFSCTPELRQTIERVRAGTFDVASLPAPRRLPPTRQGRRTKWTDEQKAQAAETRAIRKVEKQSGFLLDWRKRREPACVAAFLADPRSVGETREERLQQFNAREAQRLLAHAAELQSMADAILSAEAA